MRRLVVALVTALWLPSAAQAADYVALTVKPTKVAPGWTLSGTVTSGSFYRGGEIAGLTLRRTFLAGRGEELHALRAHPRRPTIAFDGRQGRWTTNGGLGAVAAVDLAIQATGAPVPVGEAWGCTGAFSRLPVRLTGTLVLRTGTRFFGTIRRTALSGVATFETGAVDCSRRAPATCEPSSSLHAGDVRRSLLASRKGLVVQFREPVASAPANTTAWYHVMSVQGYDALTGTLPTLGVAAPSSAIRGTVSFLGETGAEPRAGACTTTTTRGTATGTLGTTFAGWGVRTLRLTLGSTATYSETG